MDFDPRNRKTATFCHPFPEIPRRPLMCTIVPLSTTRPKIVMSHHMEIAFDPPLPAPYDSPTAWVKGDIVLTIAFHRLRLLFDRWNSGQRVYDIRVLTQRPSEGSRRASARALGFRLEVFTRLSDISVTSPVAPAIKSSPALAADAK